MMKKQLLLLVMLLSAAASAFAVEEVEIDGLWYEVVAKAKEAKVIQYKNDVKYKGDIVIPENVVYEGVTYSVTSIGVGAFENCSGLTTVTIGNSVTSIGNWAFGGCSGLTFVTIPNSVMSIGYNAFSGCSGLTSVTIGNSVTSIGYYAFSGCSGLNKVIVKDIAAWCGISFSGDSSNPLSYSRHLYSDENTEITELIIPNSVTSIGDYAFYYCSGLTSVTIGNSVMSVGNGAFHKCSGLTSVTIGNSVTSIGNWAFVGCSDLTTVTIGNSVTSIGERAFEWCSGLTFVTIPNSVTSIGDYAFYYCSGLTSVTIGNSVSSIGDGAFENCSGLTSVTIPNSVTSIGNWAFGGCSGLTSVTIGNSVTSIGDGAFYNCPGLTSVTIPNSVTSIGYGAFNECSGLTSVVVGGGVKTISSQAFANCQELTDVTCYAEDVPSTQSDAFVDSYIEYATLHVPTASIDDYKAIVPWSNFGEMVGLDGTQPDNPEPETPKCAKPTISFTNGELEFSCETEGVEFISEVTVSDAKKNYSNKVSLTGSYSVSVYATKAGYEDSEVATLEFTLGAGGTGIQGDANGDGNVTVTDIGVIVDIILGKVNQNARKLENTLEPE